MLHHLEHKKVKTIKLVRNKLTDDVFPDLWRNMGNIQSLNLSQNLLTERVVGSFMKGFGGMGNVKSLTLSQNKINVRAVRQELE